MRDGKVGKDWTGLLWDQIAEDAEDAKGLKAKQSELLRYLGCAGWASP